MLKHISIPAKEVLDKLASKRVGQTLSELELAGCDDNIKQAVKRQIYGLKKDIEKISEACDDKKSE